jgi:hypothetical protein
MMWRFLSGGGDFARRFAYTIFMEAAILLVALNGGVVTGKLSAAAASRWGFGFHNLWEGKFYTLLSAPFLVRNLGMLVGILLFLAVSVGIYEWYAGSQKTISVYWLTNLAAFLGAGLIGYILYRSGSALGRDIFFKSDVGPSAGAFGCIGAWTKRSRPCRSWVFYGILAYLLGKLVIFPEFFSDLAHLIAFPLGYALDGLMDRNGAGLDG